ncbi:LuxR C-terminal-related transcriptional regulator [Azoarcus sp. KH32C]|uniref:LuxR C-terminal-related transcriptional regulator n=1 Tax=Azoarcus sp. KH32C TaxID=748247 RepID=UPI000348CE3A|nr:LuxR C-terminal-related transcriptional regulator [Azoarcus sp. KH32C]
MSFDAPDPELVLKTTPPRIPKALLSRGRLASDNPEFRDKSIIEIQAPAGFGKTSLLGQWRRESLNRGKLVAWLTLDERDDGMRFVRGLAYAMRLASGRPGFDKAVSQATRQRPSEIDSLTAWLAEVTNLGAETLLILDEVQAAPTATIELSLHYLLLNAPPNLRIVMASRRRLDLPFSDMMARGLYANIGADRLRFTQQETLRILAERFGTKISADDGARLHEKIAGWPLGLQLAVASLERCANPAASIATMATVTSDFKQYFRDTLISGLDDESTDFLVQISVLDTLRPQLCAAVTGRADAENLLEKLRHSLPIFTEGVDSNWMRIHPMALEFLREQLQRRPPAEVRELRMRAVRWLTDNQMHEEAASHALAAGEETLAYKLIGECLYGVMAGGNQLRVLYWLDHMPQRELERHARLLLGAAWALAESSRHAEAAALVEKVIADPSASANDRFEAALISGAAAFFADNIDRAAEIFRPWKDAPPPDSMQLRGIAANAFATMALYEGEPEQARQTIRIAHARWPASVDAIRAWGEWVIGFSYVWEGQVQLAAETLRDSLSRTEEALGRRSALSATFAAALATALWECGEIDEAAELLADRLDILEQISAPESASMGYLIAARTAAARGNERRAINLLDNLFVMGTARKLPRFCVTSLSEQVRMHALRGHVETCRAASARLEALIAPWSDAPGGLLHPLLMLRASLARAFAAMARRDWRGMLALLEPAQELATRLRRGREAIESKLLRALALRHLGDDAAALIGEAVSLAGIYGLRATLLNTHPNLFDDAVPVRQTEIASLANRRDAEVTAPKRPHSRPCGLLTNKEDEVLQLLAKNFSNKQIAAALGASEETVKWHIKNLFAKLNAGSRKHAVDRARMLGIFAGEA